MMLAAKLMLKIYTDVFSVDDIGADDRLSGQERQEFFLHVCAQLRRWSFTGVF